MNAVARLLPALGGAVWDCNLLSAHVARAVWPTRGPHSYLELLRQVGLELGPTSGLPEGPALVAGWLGGLPSAGSGPLEDGCFSMQKQRRLGHR